jgi:hypothetical protein
MDEQAGGAAAFGLVVLVMMAFLGTMFLNRSGVGTMWMGAGIVFITVVMIVAATDARRR